MAEPTRVPMNATDSRTKERSELLRSESGMPLSVWMALAVAITLRLTWLSRWPLWVDELATLQRLGLSFTEHLRAMRGNHPLYELLLRLWANPDSGDVWLRIPSAVLGIIAVWLTWRLLCRLGRREAIVGTWLMALSPLHVMYSRMARSYSLAVVLALLSHLALLNALRKRKLWLYGAYALTTAAMVYANLLACSIWAAQGLFLLWFFRKRLRRLGPWILTNLAALVLVLPWMTYSFIGAVMWGAETQYTAQQQGRLAKLAYQALTLCLGETVNPLNLHVVPIAAFGFGVALTWATLRVLRRRGGMPCYLFTQIAVAFPIGLFFGAAAAKHLAVALPAWLGLAAFAVVRIPWKRLRPLLALAIFGAVCISNINYFLGREFADADMVTPWRHIVRAVEYREEPRDALLIGYQMDSGARDMFARYYSGELEPEHINFDHWREQVLNAEPGRNRIFLLLHDGDPWQEVEEWLENRGREVTMIPFQEEEHTLERIRKVGLFGPGNDFRSPLYRLYWYEPPKSKFVPVGGAIIALRSNAKLDGVFEGRNP